MTEAGHRALTEHVESCAACAAAAVPAARIGVLLDAEAAAVDAARLSRLVLARMAPELAARSPAAFWRRVVCALGVSLLPLPVVLLADGVLLLAIYRAATVLLPSSIALYLAASYAVTVLIGIGLAYAAIPLLVARRPAPRAVA
jgi:hypothetical protein